VFWKKFNALQVVSAAHTQEKQADDDVCEYANLNAVIV